MANLRSKDLARNPAFAAALAAAAAPAGGTGGRTGGAAGAPRRVAGRMNKTEARYAGRLEVMRLARQVTAYEFERWTVRLDDPAAGRALRYTPDFRVVHAGGRVSFDEVKGGHVREDAVIKFRWACEQFPNEWWRMWQWKGDAWRLLREHRPEQLPLPFD